jgi:hypothetical protein
LLIAVPYFELVEIEARTLQHERYSQDSLFSYRDIRCPVENPYFASIACPAGESTNSAKRAASGRAPLISVIP